MPTELQRVLRVALDLSTLVAAYLLAYVLRFEGEIPQALQSKALIGLPLVVCAQYACLTALAVPRCSWRHFGLREVVRLAQALGLAALGLVALRLLGVRGLLGDFGRQFALPLGVIGIDLALALVFSSAARATRRLTAERSKLRNLPTAGSSVPTLVIGAGSAGVMVAKEISARPNLGLLALGFLDDDTAKRNLLVHGVPVLGTIDDLPELAAKTGAQQALLAIASASGALVRRVQRLCREAKIPLQVVPGVYEIVDGQIEVSRIRSVQIEDLLRRDPVNLDMPAIADMAAGKTVLVTGAGGSIGSELCRQVLRFAPANLVLVEQAEPALYQIHRELAAKRAETQIQPCIGDVCDATRMRQVFEAMQPDLVLHAAAHKHVPMMEWNPGEAIKNNVRGTQVVADLAGEVGTDVFVLVSTDKAVNPTSVMGATKRVAELYCQSKAATSSTHFVTVRFGNVLGSAGSVVPLFQEQIAKGGPVTVTHPDMQRYFMTIPEACQLILQAGSMGQGGEIFVLDMGEPVKIVDVAHDLIQLSGLVPYEDVSIEFTGLRPGEKLFEELSTKAEDADRTRHPKIFVGKLAAQDHAALRPKIRALLARADAGDEAGALRQRILDVVPEFKSPNHDLPCPLGSIAAAAKVLVEQPRGALVGSST